MILPKSIPLPVISCSRETNEHIVHGIVSNKAVFSRCRTFIDAVMWSMGKIWTSLQLQNSFLYPTHPRSTITMNLWMFRFKFSLWSDYLSKNCYKFNYCRCFLNVSIHEDYNIWNFVSLYIHGEKTLCQVYFLVLGAVEEQRREWKTIARSKAVMKYLSFLCYTLEQLGLPDV